MPGGDSGEEGEKIGSGGVLPSYLWPLSPEVVWVIQGFKERRLLGKGEKLGHGMGPVKTRDPWRPDWTMVAGMQKKG